MIFGMTRPLGLCWPRLRLGKATQAGVIVMKLRRGRILRLLQLSGNG